MKTDLRAYHKTLVTQLSAQVKGNSERLRVKKKTISNLFRYSGRENISSREIDLSQFNQLLFLDIHLMTLEAQALATYEQIVDFLLPHGLLPLITPELKNITVGGATVGIGIEANSFRYGFVHNGLLEADVLLSDGRVVTCTAQNEYRDLFFALPNSYGTLGYILRVKIKLRRVLPFMELQTTRFSKMPDLIHALKKETTNSQCDSIESLIYSKDELYLTTVKQTEKPASLRSIYGNCIFYREISKPGVFSLKTKDYLFRYDPEWFWNVPQNAFFTLFRSIAPITMRNSGFYVKYAKLLTRILPGMKNDPGVEQLIQDWEVPWENAQRLLTYFLEHIDLRGLPVLVAPIKVPFTTTLYPIKKDQLYFNLGSYSFVTRDLKHPPFYHTKQIDSYCFSQRGIKMLYSSTFIGESEFNRVYNGKAYKTLKKKYDGGGLLPTLFEKAVKAM